MREQKFKARSINQLCAEEEKGWKFITNPCRYCEARKVDLIEGCFLFKNQFENVKKSTTNIFMKITSQKYYTHCNNSIKVSN